MSALSNLDLTGSGLLPTSSVTAATSAATAAAGTDAGNPYAELSSTDFVKIMVEELSNQDPFEPNDSAAILEQLSSLRSIEADLSLQDQLENLVLQNSIGQAGALIGRDVQGLSLENDPVSGVVTSVRVVDGKTEVQLDSGSSLPLERVTEVASIASPVTAAAPAAPPAALASALAAVTPDDESADAPDADETTVSAVSAQLAGATTSDGALTDG